VSGIPTVAVVHDHTAGTQGLGVSCLDTFDLPIYSTAIEVDPGQLLTISATVTSDTVVTAGSKLLVWYGVTEDQSKPGGATFSSATLDVADLSTTLTVLTGTARVPPGKEYLRVVIEIDTCTDPTENVSVLITNVTVH
jgi:hypothetical protein